MQRFTGSYFYGFIFAIWLIVTGMSEANAVPCHDPDSCGCNRNPWVADEPSCVTIDMQGQVELDEGEALVPPSKQPSFCSLEDDGIGLPQADNVAVRTSARVIVDWADEALTMFLYVAGLNAELLGVEAKFKGEIQFKCNNNVIERRSLEFQNFERIRTNRFIAIRVEGLPYRADEYRVEIRQMDAEGRARVRTTTGEREWRPITTPEERTMIFKGRRR